jgi:hypothetical protein
MEGYHPRATLMLEVTCLAGYRLRMKTAKRLDGPFGEASIYDHALSGETPAFFWLAPARNARKG